MLKLNSLHLRARLLGFGILCFASLLLPACQPKEEVLELVPVSGKVTVAGTPVPTGQVTFYPDPDKGNTSTKIPNGMIEQDGSYKLQTGTAAGVREGAPVGWYKVTVTTAGAGSPDQAKMKMPQFNPDYLRHKQTKLSVEVKTSPAANAYDLKLTK